MVGCFPILALPVELRLQILELALFTTSHAPPTEFPDSEDMPSSLQEPSLTSPPLLLINKQLNSEVTSILNNAKLNGQLTYHMDILVQNKELFFPTWTNVPLHLTAVDYLNVDFRMYEDLPGAFAGKHQYWKNLLWSEGPLEDVASLMFDAYLMLINRVLSLGIFPNLKGPAYLYGRGRRQPLNVKTLIVDFRYDDEKIRDDIWAGVEVPLNALRTLDSDDRDSKKLLRWETIVGEMERAIEKDFWPSTTFAGPVLNRVGMLSVRVNGIEVRHYNMSALEARNTEGIISHEPVIV